MLISVADIMDRFGNELVDACNDIEAIERTISEAEVGGAMPLHVALELQQLDRLLQHLAELSRFAKTVATENANGPTVDAGTALSSLRLGGLRFRLEGRSDAADASPAVTGECELL